MKKLLAITLVIAMLFCGGTLALASALDAGEQPEYYIGVVVDAETIDVYAAADNASDIVTTLPENSLVRVHEFSSSGNASYGRIDYGWVDLDHVVTMDAVDGIVVGTDALTVYKEADTESEITATLRRGDTVKLVDLIPVELQTDEIEPESAETDEEPAPIAWVQAENGWTDLTYISINHEHDYTSGVCACGAITPVVTTEPTEQETTPKPTEPTTKPTETPTEPTTKPTVPPATQPTTPPATQPTTPPTTQPTNPPTTQPTTPPATQPTQPPATQPTTPPATQPTQPPHSHSYSSAVTTGATCGSAGVRTYTCSCGDSYTESIPATGDHKWGNWQSSGSGLCTEPLTVTATCSDCGKTKTESRPAKGHSWGEWYTAEEPTCDQPGLKQRRCNDCGINEDQTIPALGHNWTSHHEDAVVVRDLVITCACGLQWHNGNVAAWSVHSAAEFEKDMTAVHSWHSDEVFTTTSPARDWTDCSRCGATK